MNVFDEDSPWITQDNRRFRPVSRTTPESMNHKHEAMLPPDTLEDRTVLDLGCCLGATGFWALQHGAAHYTGVEVQDEYVRTALSLFDGRELSARVTIHHSDLTAWLESRTRDAPGQRESYDIVVLAGVLYGYIDPLHILRMACELATECVVIDMLYPARQRDPLVPFIEIVPEQRMVVAGRGDALACGAGSRISPVGQDTVMANLGFTAERMPVRPITDTHDAYNTVFQNRVGGRYPMRYITRYRRAPVRTQSVNEAIAVGRVMLVPLREAPR